MTSPRVSEFVVHTGPTDAAPTAGAYYLSPSGKTCVCISRVRRLVGKLDRYRLFGMRIRMAELPQGVAPLPWPAKPPLPHAAARGPAEPPKLVPVPPHGRARARERIRALIRDDKNIDRPVPLVRLDNRTATLTEWRDPDDVAVNRRSPRMVHGYRNTDDHVQVLLDKGAITKRHARAARRFRKLYETGEVGLRPSRDLSMPPAGFASGSPPSEFRMQALQAYQEATAALGPRLLTVILAIVIAGGTIEAYATARRMNRSSASGYILAALDLLSDHFKSVDDQGQAEPSSV